MRTPQYLANGIARYCLHNTSTYTCKLLYWFFDLLIYLKDTLSGRMTTSIPLYILQIAVPAYQRIGFHWEGGWGGVISRQHVCIILILEEQKFMMKRVDQSVVTICLIITNGLKAGANILRGFSS